MTTIPIEVILQDAESPVTPTPESGEETNITVPDTGTISDVNNSGGIRSSASIILPAIIVVLALGAMVAILIHKHRKHQNDKLSKKEKLATIASSTIAILAATVLVGNLVIPTTSAATDDTNSNDEGELVVDDKITITVTREVGSDEATVSSVDTKSYATVYKTFGYEVAIAMAGNTTNLYLNGDTSSEYYIAPVSDGTLADNTWGYTLDGEEYSTMPLIDDLAVVTKGTAPVSNEEVDINYGVKVASDMPAGTYTGEIEYILADTGFPAALRTMQDMTTDICSSVPTPNPFKADNTTIEDNVPTIMLPDSRDNKLYRVAKLADGKCWMTQNLDLQKEDLLAGVVLNDSNTDHPAENFSLPTSQINGNINWGNPEQESDVDTARVYDPANDSLPHYNKGKCNSYSVSGTCLDWENLGDIPLSELGNYYNWFTATAGNGTYGLSDGERASGSICPHGWKLPNGGAVDTATDYSLLVYTYGISSSPTYKVISDIRVSSLFTTPFSFYLTSDNEGTNGSYWYNVSNGSTSARYYNMENYSYLKDTNPWASNTKTRMYAVRCVAR